MHPVSKPLVPPDLRPLSLANLHPPQDRHNFDPPDPIIDPPECSLDAIHCSPVFSTAPIPPDLSLYPNPLQPLVQPYSYNDDDAAEVEAAIIASAARGEQLPPTWAQFITQPNPTLVQSVMVTPPDPPKTSHMHRITEPQDPVQHLNALPPDDVGMSGSTVSGLPLPPLRSPPQVSYELSPSSSSALGLQPTTFASLGNDTSPNADPLPPHLMLLQYTRLSEREAAAVEREAAALRGSQSYGHTGTGPSEQRNAWANNQTPAQVGQPPQHTSQPLPPTGHTLAAINTHTPAPAPCIHMETSLRPAVFSSPSPESDPEGDPISCDAPPPPPPSTTASNLTSRNSSRQVSGNSVSTEVPMAIDSIAGCKRTAEEAFPAGGLLDTSGDEDPGRDGEDIEMVDELMEESESKGTAEAEEEGNQNEPVFIHEDGQRPPPKRRKFNDANNIRLPTPPRLAGTSRPPAAPTPAMVPTELDADPEVLHAGAGAGASASAPAAPSTDTTSASAHLPPPVSVFQRDPDAPPSYADWVRENQANANIERWMECTRRNLTYDPSAVPAPPEGFESGKDRKKEGDCGEGTSGDKDGDGEGDGEGEGGEGEGEGEGAGEGEEHAEKREGTTNEGSGTSNPYEINENTPPNINEGLWCLFDYPKSVKPKYSYAFMARVAILGSPTRRLQLQDIYVMIEAKFPFYRNGNHVSWKNSIRHNLSTNKWFVKCERDMVHEPGYSAMWTVDTTSKGGPKKKRERLGRSKKGRAVLAAREAAEKGIIPDPRIVALAIAMKTAPPVVPLGVPIIGSAIPPPKLPPIHANNPEKLLPLKKTSTAALIAPAPAPTPAPAPAPAPVPVPAPAPTPALAPVPVSPVSSLSPRIVPTPLSGSTTTPLAPPPADPLRGAEKETPVELDSTGQGVPPSQTAPDPPIVTMNTTMPTEPPTIIEIEAVDFPPPLPPKRKAHWKPRAPPKKSKTFDPLLASTSLASTPIPTPRRSATPPKVPTPPFMTRRLSPPAPPALNPPPQQSQPQKSRTPPVFPRLSIFTLQPAPPEPPSRLCVSEAELLAAARATSPPAVPGTKPAQVSTPPYLSTPSVTEKEKDKGGRKGFNQQLLQRLVDEKENPEKPGGNKPPVHRLFTVPTTVPSPSPAIATPTLMSPSTSFGSATAGTGFGGFALTKGSSFGSSTFGMSTPATGGFGGFGSKAGPGPGSGFATFGTTATGPSITTNKFRFTPAVFSNQASTSSIKTSNVRGEDNYDNEESRDSDTDIGDDLRVDMDIDVEDDPGRDAAGELKVSTAPKLHSKAETQAQEQPKGSGSSVPGSSITTLAPVSHHLQVNMASTNVLPNQTAPPGLSPNAPIATHAPIKPIVTPLSPPASPTQGPTTNTLPPTSLFYLDPKPKRRHSPAATSSAVSSMSGPTDLIKRTIRKYVTLDPMTLVPTIVDLDRALGDLYTKSLVVHHNFLPRAPPLNGDYHRGLENLLKKRRRKHGEPGVAYRGAGDDDLGSVIESDDSGVDTELL